jgi:hypothetical protein
MNPTQIFEFAMNWINQKIIKFNRVPLGQNRARPSRTARAWPTATWAHGPWPRGAQPSSASPRNALRTARARARCMAAARRRRVGDDWGMGGSPVQGRWRGAASTGEQLQSGRRHGQRGGRGDGGARETGRCRGGREGGAVGARCQRFLN